MNVRQKVIIAILLHRVQILKEVLVVHVRWVISEMGRIVQVFFFFFFFFRLIINKYIIECTTSNPCPICSLIDGITLVCSKQESLILYGSRTIESLFEVKGLNFPLSPYATITLQIWLSTSDPDQTIRLYGPDGSYITLSNQRGSSYEDVFDGTLFTDSASNSVSTYKFSKDGVVSPLRPEQPFSNFIDENPNGQWKLRIGSLQGIFLIGVGKLDGFIFNIKGCFFF